MYIAKDTSDFIKKINEALMENNTDICNKRISIAKMNTWDKRVKEVLLHLK